MNRILYFDNPGRENFKKTVDCVYKRLKKDNNTIRKIVLFSATYKSIEYVKTVLSENAEIYVATYPHQQPMYKENEETKSIDEYVLETSNTDSRRKIEELGATLLQSSLPLDDIILPGSEHDKLRMIQWVYDTISTGLTHCINSAIMLCDSGYAMPGEDVITFAADTAVVITVANKTHMFHPKKGIHIKEILCKPY